MTQSTPPAGDDKIYRAISSEKEAARMAEAKKSLADLGLAKVTFVYLDAQGKTQVLVKTVQQETAAAVAAMITDGEIG